MSNFNHIMVLCAYKESPYLEECLMSLLNQTEKTGIAISTSTPNDYIQKIADKYGIKVYSHSEGNSAQHNFNYALGNIKADYITLCHQDDIYEPWFAEEVHKKIRPGKDVIYFTDYYEIRPEGKIYGNRLLRVKRLMNVVFRVSRRSRFIRKRLLSLGSPICCPSITYAMDKCVDFRFSLDYRNSFDWEGLTRLACIKGRFVYVPHKLVGHRIYQESLTSESISNNKRYNEDLSIYRKFWPEKIAKRLMKKYAKSMDSNG